MVFVMLQIRCGTTILKPFYGCDVPEGSTITDIFSSFSSGRLDNSLRLFQNSINVHLLPRLARIEMIV